MILIQRNDVIEQLASDAAYPALGHSVLPGALYARPDRLETTTPQKLQNRVATLGITIEQNIMMRTGERKGFPQLLHHPVAGGMRRHLKVQDAPTTVFDDKEAIKHPEVECGHSKEIHRGDDFPVIV